MTEVQMIAAFEEATVLHANEGAQSGLHPMHIANILMLAAMKISVQFGSVAETRAGLLMAAENIGKDGMQ
jgi:hypothetical protein